MKKPNFFIVSSPRSGTTTLYEYFKNIPEIFMPTSLKEPHYFSDDVLPYGHNRSMTEEEYLNLFSKVKNEMSIGEASTSYLRNPKAAKKIFEFNPDAKIIILIRDPVKRIISEYLWYYRTGEEKLPVNDAIKRDRIKTEKENAIPKILEGGLYAKQIQKYFELFKKEQIKLVIFEEFTKNFHNEMKGITDFLGIKTEPIKKIETKINEFKMPRGDLSRNLVSNSTVAKILLKILPNSTIRRILREKILEKKSDKPKIIPENIKWLENFYKNDIKELEKFLNIQLPWKNSK